MITEKQRRRALARAKWERQQARRTAAQKRTQRVGITIGVAATVVFVILIGWGVAYLVTNDDSDSPSTPVTPSNTLTFKTPTDPGSTTIYSPPTTGAPTTAKTTGAASQPTSSTPATTGATR